MAGPKAAVVKGKSFSAPAGDGWALDFIFAGGSALLLLCANFFPAYWYLSFFGLTPFLGRITKAGFRSGLRLGFLLGLAFLFVSKLDSFFSSPFTASLQLAAGVSLFALFGAAVGRANEKWDFNPLITALLWVGFELGLVKAGFASGILETHQLLNSSTFFYGLGVLFGFLAISFVIVLINSILILAVEKIVLLAKAGGQGVWEIERIGSPSPIPGLFAQRVYWVPEGRGPPVSSL